MECQRCNGDRHISGAYPDLPDEPCPVCNKDAPSGAERVRETARFLQSQIKTFEPAQKPSVSSAVKSMHKIGTKLQQSNAKLTATLEQIRDMPCSMVNDSESLRHTIRTMQSIAAKVLK